MVYFKTTLRKYNSLHFGKMKNHLYREMDWMHAIEGDSILRYLWICKTRGNMKNIWKKKAVRFHTNLKASSPTGYGEKYHLHCKDFN